MKIEIGESLFCSWLKHVKGCQVVQTNWKPSLSWTLNHYKDLNIIMEETNNYYHEEYDYDIYKKNASLDQVIKEGECDLIGVVLQNGVSETYAVDVAFHESGLNYGTKKDTIKRIILKCIRTAMTIYGYCDIDDAEIIFAAPKIGKSILPDAI